MADRATKMELILAGNRILFCAKREIRHAHCIDEGRIREITQNLSQIETLARVLDGQFLQGLNNLCPNQIDMNTKHASAWIFLEVPKLAVTLDKLLTTHGGIKVSH